MTNSARRSRPAAPPPLGDALRSALPAIAGIQWFTADEDPGELVLTGRTGEAFHQLAEELRHVDRFVRAKIDPPTRLLFSGPTGTGKTLSARWLGCRLRLPVAVTDISATLSSYVNGTAKALGEAFGAARSVRCILFLDEIDGLCVKRGGGSGEGSLELARATTALLQQLDWLDRARIVIAATNFADLLDSALRRRFTTELVFELPNLEARRRMVGHWLADAAVPEGVLDQLAESTEGLGGAELRSAAMALARRAIMAGPAARIVEIEPVRERRDVLLHGAQQVLRALSSEPAGEAQGGAAEGAHG